MTDSSEGDRPELPEFSWSDFLTTCPPGTPAKIKDLVGRTTTGSATIAIPELVLHCSSDTCRGERIFAASKPPLAAWAEVSNVFLTYSCRNCASSERIFALLLHPREFPYVDGLAVKIGEWPPFGPPTPARVISMVGPDRSLFLKGRRAENHGLGLGAFAYYRRVVEEQKTRLLTEIIRVAKRSGAKPAAVSALEAAAKEQQFSKAIDLTKDAIPESLLIDGHNPLFLLHRALSVGLHDLSDEECLARARSIRVILTELADRISQVLKDTAELKEALSHLLAEPQRTEKPAS